jgi:hypothetical protein
MKRLVLGLAALLLSSCGGGGGGGYDLPAACEYYCQFGCAAVFICEGISDSDALEECSSTCKDEISDSEPSAAMCQDATNNIAGMTCEEIEQIIGLQGQASSQTLTSTFIGKWVASNH